MPKTVKHGNISIELFKGRYIISHKEDAYAENACECLSFPESELHDLELCLHKLRPKKKKKKKVVWTPEFNPDGMAAFQIDQEF